MRPLSLDFSIVDRSRYCLLRSQIVHFMYIVAALVSSMLSVSLGLQLTPIRVGHIEDFSLSDFNETGLQRQKQRLDRLRQQLDEKAKMREDELDEAARQYTGSKLFEETQKILGRFIND